MKVDIIIDQNNGTANAIIKTDEDIEINWQTLQNDDKENIIRALYGFTRVFQDLYLKDLDPGLLEHTETVSTDSDSVDIDLE